MPIPNKFPYVNFHDINLNWILRTVKQLKGEVDALDLVAVNTRLDTVEENAADAKQAASSADANASTALEVATDAETTANAISATAQQANNTAADAKASAEQANNTAADAKASAEQANETAQNASASASQASNKAEQAQTAANNAQRTANTNAAAITTLGQEVLEKLGFSLVWTNASPGSAFAEQTVVVSGLSGAKGAIVTFRGYYDDQYNYSTFVVLKDVPRTCCFFRFYPSWDAYRSCYIPSDGVIGFSNAFRVENASETQNNYCMIPNQIYAIK